MDIGPVRRRLTAEPVSSPVPGEASPIVEPAMLDTEHPAHPAHPVPADAAATTTRPEPAR